VTCRAESAKRVAPPKRCDPNAASEEALLIRN